MSTLTLNVNGRDHTVIVSSSEMPLLWVLRDLIGLTGTKYGCGIEDCGASTVLVGGQPEKSCKFDVTSAVGKPIVMASDYVRAVPEQIRAFLPPERRCVTLGTDGFGRSDTRAALRAHFEVDAAAIVQAALRALG